MKLDTGPRPSVTHSFMHTLCVVMTASPACAFYGLIFALFISYLFCYGFISAWRAGMGRGDHQRGNLSKTERIAWP